MADHVPFRRIHWVKDVNNEGWVCVEEVNLVTQQLMPSGSCNTSGECNDQKFRDYATKQGSTIRAFSLMKTEVGKIGFSNKAPPKKVYVRSSRLGSTVCLSRRTHSCV